MLGYIVVVLPAINLIENLWPRKSLPDAPSVGSDGWQLMRTPFLKEVEIEESLASTYVQEARFAVLREKSDDPLTYLNLGLRQFPSHWLLHCNCGACYLAQHNYPEAVDQFTKALESPLVPVAIQTRILDQLACIPLFSRETEFLQQADEWSRRALEIDPLSLTLKATRGSVLIDLGKIEEGRVLLEDVLQNSAVVSDRYVCACFLALAASKMGELLRASRMVHVARHMDVKSVLLDALVRELNTAPLADHQTTGTSHATH